MFNDPLIWLGAGLFASALALLLLRQKLMRKSAPVDTIFVKGRTTTHNWGKIYKFFTKCPWINNYTRQIRKQLEIYFPDSERLVVQMTCKVVCIVVFAVVAMFLVVLIFKMSFYIMLCCIFAIFVINQQVLQTVIRKNKAHLLAELNIFMEKVQFNFLHSHMIDEAIRDSLDGKLKLIERHGVKILKILQSEDLESDLQQYINVVSDKFLREFLCICVTTHVYGDSESNGQSRFLQSLKGLKARIGSEQRREEEIQFTFKFLPLLCAAPVFALDIIADWGISVISELEPYYHGYYGIISTVVCFVLSLGSYILMNFLKDAQVIDYSSHEFLTKLYMIPFIQKAIDSYYNNNYGRYKKYSKLLRQIGSKLTPYTLMAKRLLFGLCGFLLTVALFFGINMYTKNRINTQVTGNGGKSSMASETESITMMLMNRGYTDKYLEYDAVEAYNLYAASDPNLEEQVEFTKVVKDYWQQVLIDDFVNGDGCEISDEVAYQTIYQYNKEHSTSTKIFTQYLGTGDGVVGEAEYVEQAEKQLTLLRETAEGVRPLGDKTLLYESVAGDVMDRVQTYQAAYFRWQYMLIAVAIAVLAFMLPFWWLLFTQRESQQLMEEEIMQFQALILTLMPIQVMSVSIIMDWMLKFSVIFRPSLHKCYIYLDSDSNKAFNDLIEAEPYAPLQELVRKLQMCDRVGVQKAFFNMEVTHNNFCEHKRQSEKMQLTTNSNLGGIIAMVPMLLVLAMHLIVPFLVESFGQLAVTMQQIGTM